MNQRKGARPYCFGKVDCVFPKGPQGLRETPASCFPCIFKVECLRLAVNQGEGLIVKEEAVDRAYEAGVIGFWARWSRKKSLQREMGEKKQDKPVKAEGSGKFSPKP